jgi:Domain of unknown function (DUF4157)
MNMRAQNAMKKAAPTARPLTPVGTLQRKCACGGSGGSDAECADCRKKKLQRSAAGNGPEFAPPIVHDVLDSPGQPLDGATRSYFEPRFGHDFGKVRIHADERAGESAQSVNALAYTVGPHIAFAAGQYRPRTASGQQLLAHELTHVVQQQGSSTPPSSLRVGAEGDSFEREAEGAASAAVSGSALHVAQPASATVQRQTAPGPSGSPNSAPQQSQPSTPWGHDPSCQEADLKSHIWPGDALARKMLASARQALAASPTNPAVQKLLQRYFMTATPNLGTINGVYSTLQAQFDQGGYQYACREDCESTAQRKTVGATKVSPLLGASGPVVLCMNNLRPLPVSFTAETILHEFCHRYASLNSVDVYCDTGCPSGLSAADALRNPDSYAQFASEVDSKSGYVPGLKGQTPQTPQTPQP